MHYYFPPSLLAGVFSHINPLLCILDSSLHTNPCNVLFSELISFLLYTSSFSYYNPRLVFFPLLHVTVQASNAEFLCEHKFDFNKVPDLNVGWPSNIKLK